MKANFKYLSKIKEQMITHQSEGRYLLFTCELIGKLLMRSF